MVGSWMLWAHGRPLEKNLKQIDQLFGLDRKYFA